MPSRTDRRGFLRTSSRSTRNAAPRSGNPAAVPFQPGSWDVSGPVAFFVIPQGATMFGIAARYLGNGARWTEIRAIQAPGSTQWGPSLPRDSTAWFPGDGCVTTVSDDENGNEVEETVCSKTPYGPGSVIRMPEEAKTRMLAMLATSEPRSAPAEGNAPGNYPGANPLEPFGLEPIGPNPNPGPEPEPKPKPKEGGGAGVLFLIAAAAATAALS